MLATYWRVPFVPSTVQPVLSQYNVQTTVKLAVWAQYWLVKIATPSINLLYLMFLICTCVHYSVSIVAKRNKRIFIIMGMHCWPYGPASGPILASVNCTPSVNLLYNIVFNNAFSIHLHVPFSLCGSKAK